MNGNEHEKRLDGLNARIFQHEMDHLNGILFIERLSLSVRDRLSQTLYSLKRGISDS
ncbi:peptide deformylase [Candidatus Latescibacterota bacterium]